MEEQSSVAQKVTAGERPLAVVIPLLLLPLMIVFRLIPGLIENGPAMIWMLPAFGPALVGFAILGWWVTLSRARWLERLLGLVGVIALIAIVIGLSHPSLHGPLMVVLTIPTTIAAFALGLIFTRNLPAPRRTWLALGAAALAASGSLLIKTDGAWGNFNFGMAPRWSETAEDKMLAERKDQPVVAAVAEISDEEATNSPWPTFRGPNFDSSQRGVVFTDDWKANPPKELWRIPVGPAWSSFVAAGNYLFTQEQRGEEETTVCYDAETGKQVWEFATAGRFFEGLGGLGPRATPTFANGFVYSLGAEGLLTKLDARTGKLIWKADVQTEAGRSGPPMWGYSASPLVEQGLVVVHAGGKDSKGILAFDDETGKPRWSAAAGENSYASVQVIEVLGEKYLALLSDLGAHLMDPQTGAMVLDYAWPHVGYRALQPQVIGGDKLLIPTGLGTGTRLVQLAKVDGKLTAEELWTSLDLKPDFNDAVIYENHIYGFDNAIFTCLDLNTGKRKWKGGRYEKGQALLLTDSGLILVVSERGALVLLRANPERHEELAKIPALAGKTWNHPIVVGDRLYMRNSEEAVCYELGTRP